MNSVGADQEHPAARYEADIARAKGRAKASVVCLGLTAGLRVCTAIIESWQYSLVSDMKGGAKPAASTLELSDSLFALGGLAELVLVIVTAVFFLRWLYITVRLAKALDVTGLRWTPSQAVWGYFIPLVSFARPFRVMRDLHDRLAPHDVPEPQMQVRAGEAGYRDVKFDLPPAPVKLPAASIGGWWVAFWVSGILSNIASRQTGESIDDLLLRNALYVVSDAVDLVSAILAIVVVQAVTARLVERFRRIRYNTPEALATAGIVMDGLRAA